MTRRRPPPTITPQPRRANKSTFAPQTPLEWETRATLLEQERDLLRLTLKVIAQAEGGCPTCWGFIDAAKSVLAQHAGHAGKEG